MTTQAWDEDDDRVEQIAAEIVDRLRRGERPTVEEYAAQHPDVAPQIIALFPALILMERGKPRTDESKRAAADFPSSLAAGQVADHEQSLGEYRILREIGRGGMGIVYEAEHSALKNRVALKVMHPRFRSDAASLRRFQREARSAARLHHTNIVPVFDFGQHEGVSFYAMQLVDGVGLDHVLDDVRRLREPAERTSPGCDHEPLAAALIEKTSIGTSPSAAPEQASVSSGSWSASSFSGHSGAAHFREVAKLGARIADALDYAHRQGVVHRDIKPSNILLDVWGNFWITDFGLAKLADEDELSRSHDVVGTLRFMAPERFRGESDHRCDIYSLCATLYELIALRPAFSGRDHAQLIEQIALEQPRPLRQLERRVPRDLETIVQRGLAKDYTHRFATAGLLRDELERFLDGRPIRSRRAGTLEQSWRWCKRNPWLAAANCAAAALVTLLAIVSTVAAWTHRAQNQSLRFENALRKTAEADTRRALVESLVSEATALQRGGVLGQRVDSLRRLSQAGRLLLSDREPEARQALIRDQAIAAMGLSDLEVEKTVEVGPVMSHACDRQLKRSAVLEYGSGETVVRSLNDGRELVRLPHPGRFFSHAIPRFSPDGRHLLVSYLVGGRSSSLLDVWNLERRERVLHRPAGARVYAFARNGPRLVFHTAEKQLVLWDLQQSREVSRMPLNFLPETLRLDGPGRRVAVNAASGQPAELRILDLENRTVVASWKDNVGHNAMDWSSDGRLIAVGDQDGQIFVWDVERGRYASLLTGHTSDVTQCQFAPQSHLLATSSWDFTTRLWDAASGEPLLTAPDLRCSEFSEDGRRLALWNGNALLLGRLIHGGPSLSLIPGVVGNLTSKAGRQIDAAEFSPDGRIAAIASHDFVVLYEMPEGRELARLKTGKCESVLFDSATHNLITSGGHGLFRWPIRHDPGAGQAVLQIGPPELLREAAPGYDRCRAAWLPDRRTIALIDNWRACIALLDTRALHLYRQRDVSWLDGPNHAMTGVAISPDGRYAAASARSSPRIRVWDLMRRRVVKELAPGIAKEDNTFFVAFSPDSRWLVCCTHNPLAPGYHFWEAGTWKPGVFVPKTRTASTAQPVFEPGGLAVAIGVSLQQVRLSDPATGRALANLTSTRSRSVSPLAFSPDGSQLIASTSQHTALIWDLRRITTELTQRGLTGNTLPFPWLAAAPETPKQGQTTAVILSARVVGEALELRTRRAAEMADVERRLRLDPADSEPLFHKGWLSSVAGRWHDAASALERGLSLQKDDASACYLLSEAYLNTGRLSEAKEQLDHYLANVADDDGAREQRALLALQLDESRLAASDFTRLIENDVRPDNAHLGRARAWIKLGRWEQALADLYVALLKQPRDSVLLELKSAIHEQLRQEDAAKATRFFAAALPRPDPEPLNTRAWTLVIGPGSPRDPEWALMLARKAVALAPDVPTYRNTLGITLYRTGRYSEAVGTLEKNRADGKGQFDACALFFLAMARFKLGQIGQANAEFEHALDWRKRHSHLPQSCRNEELDAFEAETRAVLGACPPSLPDDVFTPAR